MAREPAREGRSLAVSLASPSKRPGQSSFCGRFPAESLQTGVLSHSFQIGWACLLNREQGVPARVLSRDRWPLKWGDGAETKVWAGLRKVEEPQGGSTRRSYHPMGGSDRQNPGSELWLQGGGQGHWPQPNLIYSPWAENQGDTRLISVSSCRWTARSTDGNSLIQPPGPEQEGRIRELLQTTSEISALRQ